MHEVDELIVSFRRGLSEAEARRVVERAGGSIRRRMRTDDTDEVMLLVRIPSDRFDEAHRALKKDDKVARTEVNRQDYEALD